MAHKCKCPKCGIEFDRDKIQAVKVNGRRYGHASCYPEITELVPLKEDNIDPDLKDLKDYIDNLFGDKCNWAMIMKQIKDYTVNKGYTYSGIKKSLEYFYNVKNGSKEKYSGSIGIVPFVYQDAYNYYLNLFITQQKNTQILDNIEEFKPEIKEFTFKISHKKEPKNLFKFLDEE